MNEDVFAVMRVLSEDGEKQWMPTIVPLNSGTSIIVFKAGEYGRGRSSVHIYVNDRELFNIVNSTEGEISAINRLREEVQQVPSWRLGTTRSGRLAVRPMPNQQPTHEIIRHVLGMGFRGSAMIDSAIGVSKLAEGYVAQGAAGRCGGCPEPVWLAPLAKEVSLVWSRSGRLYGKPAVMKAWRPAWGAWVVGPAEEVDAAIEMMEELE